MKTLSFFAVAIFSLFSFSTVIAQTSKTETIKVWGNCGMCKTNIEKAARKAGAAKASWNEDSKELKVTYAVSKTSSSKIQEAIAKSGYDTQDFTADNTAYSKLHTCCQYDRKDAGTNSISPATESPKAATDVVYVCPMHPDVTSDKPGKCSKCGMELKKKQ